MPTSVLEARASEEFTTSELSQAVDIAIILGASLPSPIGSHLYITRIQKSCFNSYENDFEFIRSHTVGAYRDFAEALAGLKNYCLDCWSERASLSPWSQMLDGSHDAYRINEEIFVLTHTDKEIIDYFFNTLGENDLYDISQVRTSSSPRI